MAKVREWRYKNLTGLGLGLALAVFISRLEVFHQFLWGLGELGYAGAFIAGVFFVSTFTVATAVVVLLILSEGLSPLEIGVFAGAGAVVGDFTIFKFIKDNILRELEALYNNHNFGVARHDHHLTRVFHSKYFSWLFPVIGAIIIASPLPDEAGVSLMGIANMKTYKFLILSFVLNAVGIFLVVSFSNFIRP